ncbi:MAG: hypothetical protein ACM3UX_00840 [Candidatus Woesearchaeota archaeon]
MTGLEPCEGMVACPKRSFAGMARDACVAEQARCGAGCGFACPRGREAVLAREKYLRDEEAFALVRAAVQEKHRLYYRKWGKLPSQQYRPTGRPQGRPRKSQAPRPGGVKG